MASGGWSLANLSASAAAAGGAGRVVRTAATVAVIAADYALSTSLSPTYGRLSPADADAALSVVHTRNAGRMRRLCEANGGLYIKLGQHAAQLHFLVPPEYCEGLTPLLSACPVRPYAEVAATVAEELGAPPDEVFASFDRTPIASASLAQVHRAVLADGSTPVAVKVQHRGLRDAAAGDIATVKALVAAVHALFPAFNYSWLAEETERNLPRELDFLNEAANNEACVTAMASRPELAARVVTPDVVWPLTSPRVLTMSWEPGVPLADPAGVVAAGLDPAAVGALVADAFAHMVFRSGWVHSDPHPSNVLVRPAPAGTAPAAGGRGPGTPQLVLLDHGLYQQLSPDFRLEYARLWRAILLADVAGLRRGAEVMGVGEHYKLFASMLTMRSWASLSGEAPPAPTAADATDISGVATATGVTKGASGSRLRAATAMPSARQNNVAALSTPPTASSLAELSASARTSAVAAAAAQLLGRVPRPLLLVLKVNDNLRAVAASLSAPPSATVAASAMAVAELLDAADSRRGVSGWVARKWAKWQLVWRVWAYAWSVWAARVWAAVMVWLGGGANEGRRTTAATLALQA
ncbi:hypothetical protein MMPV_001403 [Pyropia vietnamensis]